MTLMTEAQYKAALARVDELFDLPALTLSHVEELDDLATRIREYEDVHYPMRVPTPEEMAEFLRDQGIRK
jgi:antitoxin component HigA of HigAB toxin-antitoxin module